MFDAVVRSIERSGKKVVDLSGDVGVVRRHRVRAEVLVEVSAVCAPLLAVWHKREVAAPSRPIGLG